MCILKLQAHAHTYCIMYVSIHIRVYAYTYVRNTLGTHYCMHTRMYAYTYKHIYIIPQFEDLILRKALGTPYYNAHIKSIPQLEDLIFDFLGADAHVLGDACELVFVYVFQVLVLRDLKIN
jgi:hypothetical protein